MYCSASVVCEVLRIVMEIFTSIKLKMNKLTVESCNVLLHIKSLFHKEPKGLCDCTQDTFSSLDYLPLNTVYTQADLLRKSKLICYQLRPIYKKG